MNLFSVPKDNLPTLHCLHFEISKLLKDDNDNIIYTYPINPMFNIKYVLILEGNRRSAQLKKSKIITQILGAEIGNDKNDSKDFIGKVLYSIDKKFNEDFFKFTIDEGYSTKSTPIIKADY